MKNIIVSLCVVLGTCALGSMSTYADSMSNGPFDAHCTFHHHSDSDKHCCPGPTGATGPRGATGPIGPMGIPGPSFNNTASGMSTSSDGTFIYFDNATTSGSLSYSNGLFTLNSGSGIFLVNATYSADPTASESGAFQIYLNSNATDSNSVNAGTTLGSGGAASTIVSMKAGDTLSLQGTPGFSAGTVSITILQIGNASI